MLRFAAICAGAAMLILPTAGQAKTLPPEFECTSTDFAPTRQAFAKAVKARNATALLALTARNIEWSYGDTAGKPGFIREWKLGSAKTAATSAIWKELDEIILLGCAVDDDFIVMPHMFWRMDSGGEGVGMTYLITGTNVNLRDAPSKSGKVITQLSWEVVQTYYQDGKSTVDGWQRVKTDAGQIGYVASEYARVDIDYRAVFTKQKGKWMMTAFVAGD